MEPILMLPSEIKSFIKQTNILKYEKSNPTGAFASYYEFVNGLGAKVVFKWCLSHLTKIYETKKALLQSRLWKAAQREAQYLRRAQKTKIVPKFYGLTIVKITRVDIYDTWADYICLADYSYYPAIWMEHIEGMKLDVFYPAHGSIDHPNYQVREGIIAGLKWKILKEAGLKMLDIHEDNIIVVPRENNPLEIERIVVIDFSPPLIRKVG